MRWVEKKLQILQPELSCNWIILYHYVGVKKQDFSRVSRLVIIYSTLKVEIQITHNCDNVFGCSGLCICLQNFPEMRIVHVYSGIH